MVVQDDTSAMSKQIGRMGVLFIVKGNEELTSLPDFIQVKDADS